MYYVVFTVAMLFSSHGRVVTTEMINDGKPLQAIDQHLVPLGARAQYMDRQQVEQMLLLFRCAPAPATDNTYQAFDCAGMEK